MFLHALSRPSTICPFHPHGWSAPNGLPLLLRKQPIWAAGDTPHLMPVEQGLPSHPLATGLAGQAIPFVVVASHAPPPPPLTRSCITPAHLASMENSTIKTMQSTITQTNQSKGDNLPVIIFPNHPQNQNQW